MSDFDNPEIKISDYSAISYLQISFMIYFDEILGWDVIVYRGPIIYYILHVLTSCIRECLFHYRNHERVFVIVESRYSSCGKSSIFSKIR